MVYDRHKTYLFPSIDLRDGKVVRLLHGDYDRQTTYEVDPVGQARHYADAGATWMHVVDLDGARTGTPAHLEQISAICKATDLRVEVGGGIRSNDTIDGLLACGVKRVILGTAALENWQWFEGLMEHPVYRGRLALGLDTRDGKVAVHGWSQQTDTTALALAQHVTDWPLGAIIYTDIATDGTLQGPNVPAASEIAHSTHVPVIASGGVGTLDHLRALRPLPLHGVIVGRALYEDAFTVDEALQVLEKGG